MNNVSISGRVSKNGTVRGSSPRVLSFVIESLRTGCDGFKKDSVDVVPCVVFNPSDEIETALTREGKGLIVELEGRIRSSAYEARGEVRYTCELVVRNRTLVIHPVFSVAG